MQVDLQAFLTLRMLFCYFILSTDGASRILFPGSSLAKECVLFIDIHHMVGKPKIAVKGEGLDAV
jgi:hypothetical protein